METETMVLDSAPVLGSSDTRDINIDLEKLLATRMLITSASGGGKSWAIRRIMEQTANLVQSIIIDPEGEFSSLAKKFPYLVCGVSQGDIKINIATAACLAAELMERNASAILDISEYDPDERSIFIAEFIKGLMQLPQSYWHHVLIVIDEAHLFCPQHDKSEAKKPIIDLAGRGRKRGFCPILATQRLSKLNKSAAAELQNRMIGLAFLDTDVKRSAEELGMNANVAGEILSNLNPGEFMVYGPALTQKMEKLKVGPIVTQHGFEHGSIKPPASITQGMLEDMNLKLLEANAESAARNIMTQDELQIWAMVEAKRRLVIISPLLHAMEVTEALLSEIEEESGVTADTLKKWLDDYSTKGHDVVALMPTRQAGYQLIGMETLEAESPDELLVGVAKKRYQIISPLLNRDMTSEARRELFTNLEERYGTKPNTINRWIRDFMDGGEEIEALVPQRRPKKSSIYMEVA